jgi:hypothetical protein
MIYLVQRAMRLEFLERASCESHPNFFAYEQYLADVNYLFPAPLTFYIGRKYILNVACFRHFAVEL